MAKKTSGFITAFIFVLTALVIGVLFFAPERIFKRPEPDSLRPAKQTRIVIPQTRFQEDIYEEDYLAENPAYEDGRSAKVALNEGETIVSVLTGDLDGDLQDEQLIAYRNLSEPGSPIYITYVGYDDLSGGYKRIWNSPTMITRPGTVSLYTQDLLGDRSVSVIVTGINAAGEHTLTALRKNESSPDRNAGSSGSAAGDNIGNRVGDNVGNRVPGDLPFTKIAEIRIDGSIVIQEVERTQAYQRGISNGQSFAIAAYGRDNNSANMLDQLEIIYVYNPAAAFYEQSRITRIPGARIEQRRVSELLGGNPAVFERFIDGLWYYAGADGMPDSQQYIFFNLSNRELIFYGDESQQVFTWLNSSSTRYGLYISTQNITVTTLRRSLNIELESLDSIRVRVSEDVGLKLGVNDSWDGSYRKAGSTIAGLSDDPLPVVPYLDASYDGSIGKLIFFKDGFYELYAQGTVRKGKYTFFALDGYELLELRPGGITGLSRETYLVSRQIPESSSNSQEDLSLIRVRLGTGGIQEVHEATISLAPILSETGDSTGGS